MNNEDDPPLIPNDDEQAAPAQVAVATDDNGEGPHQIEEMDEAPEVSLAPKAPLASEVATFDSSPPAQCVGLTSDSILFDVVPLEDQYGPNQRGCISKAAKLEAPDIIHVDRALVYVSYDIDPENREGHHFFTGAKMGYPVVPKALHEGLKRGCLHAALTGMLIRDHEDKAAVFLSSEIGLHGRVNVVKYAPPAEMYPVLVDEYFGGFGAEKRARWPLIRVARLYGVVQVNAMVGIVPLSSNVYGAGLFAGSVFFNHSCTPNAAAVMSPGTLTVHALRAIEPGDEITIAYEEYPFDAMSLDMIRTFHMNMGLEDGCHCTTCNEVERMEHQMRVEDGQNVDDARVVDADLSLIWLPDTNALLRGDEKLRAYVMSMIRAPAHREGAAAACALRTQYEHLFLASYPTNRGPRENKSYAPDLAFVLGDIYCGGGTLHIPNQDVADLRWWPAMFTNAVGYSESVDLPRSLDKAMLARCYGALQCCGRRASEDEEGQREDTNLFVANWIALRHLHAARYGHTGHLIVPMKAYPWLGTAVSATQNAIRVYEARAIQEELSGAPEAAAAAAEGENEEQQQQQQQPSTVPKGPVGPAETN